MIKIWLLFQYSTYFMLRIRISRLIVLLFVLSVSELHDYIWWMSLSSWWKIILPIFFACFSIIIFVTDNWNDKHLSFPLKMLYSHATIWTYRTSKFVLQYITQTSNKCKSQNILRWIFSVTTINNKINTQSWPCMILLFKKK